MVWCKGGSRYVEGCWGLPYLRIEKFVGLTKFPFHVFDRYDIHIHYFKDFIWRSFIICRCPSSPNLITNEAPEVSKKKQYIDFPHFYFSVCYVQIFKFQSFVFQNSNVRNFECMDFKTFGTYTFPRHYKLLVSKIYKNMCTTCFQDFNICNCEII